MAGQIPELIPFIFELIYAIMHTIELIVLGLRDGLYSAADYDLYWVGWIDSTYTYLMIGGIVANIHQVHKRAKDFFYEIPPSSKPTMSGYTRMRRFIVGLVLFIFGMLFFGGMFSIWLPKLLPFI